MRRLRKFSAAWKISQFLAAFFVLQKALSFLFVAKDHSDWKPVSVVIYSWPLSVTSVTAITIVEGIVAAALSLAFVLLLRLEQTSEKSVLRNFFGLGKTDAITVVLPAHAPEGDSTLKPSNAALKFAIPPGWGSFRKSFALMLAEADVATFSQLVERASKIGVRLTACADMDIVHLKQMKPLKEKLNDIDSILVFGSPASNVLSKWLFEELVEPLDLLKFQADVITIVSKQNAPADPILLSASSDLLDYAVLGRFTDGKINSRKTYFICAGINQSGSIFAARYLFDDWESINKETCGEDFIFAYKLERNGLTNKEVYAQADATREKAFVRDRKTRCWKEITARKTAP